MPHLPLIVAKLRPASVIDILAVAVLIYNFFSMVRGRRAAHVLIGLAVLLVAYVVAVWAHLELLRSVLAAMAPYTAIALIVVFPVRNSAHPGAHRPHPLAGIGRPTGAARDGG